VGPSNVVLRRQPPVLQELFRDRSNRVSMETQYKLPLWGVGFISGRLTVVNTGVILYFFYFCSIFKNTN